MKAPPWTFLAEAVEVLFLDPECAADAAVILGAVPERPVMGLEIVAGPGPPPLEFPLGRRRAGRGGGGTAVFREVIHAI